MKLTDPSLLQHRTGYWSGAFQTLELPTFAVDDPATGATLARLPTMGRDQAEQACASAAEALSTTLSIPRRQQLLTRIATAHRDHADDLARIITAENGKPLAEARGEVGYAATFYDEAARHVPALAPRTLSERPRGLTWRVHARPAGVAALITPFNFPLAMLAKKLSGALAAGCSVVCKPAEKTPLSVVALFHLLDRLDLPPGLVNLVFGDPEPIGRVLCEHPAVRVVSFTGSTRVGQWLARTASPHMKRLSLELGGNAPFVVFADADLELAADQLMANKFRCGGQTCVCTNRVLVQREVVEAFAALVTARTEALKVGPGDQEQVDIGPLISADGLAKVQGHLADALDRGATRVGGVELPSALAGGTYFAPTVITGVTPQMACFREETFGPLVAITAFDDEAHAVRLAEDTTYGLAAYVFSGDPARLERVAAQLHFGHVGLNTGSGPTPQAPFGGMRMSGVGREGGEEGVLEYVEWQTTPIGG